MTVVVVVAVSVPVPSCSIHNFDSTIPTGNDETAMNDSPWRLDAARWKGSSRVVWGRSGCRRAATSLSGHGLVSDQ
jgi:hypothetical protein